MVPAPIFSEPSIKVQKARGIELTIAELSGSDKTTLLLSLSPDLNVIVKTTKVFKQKMSDKYLRYCAQ